MPTGPSGPSQTGGEETQGLTVWPFHCSFLSSSGAALLTHKRGGSVSLFTAIKLVPHGASPPLLSPAAFSNQKMIHF